MAELIWAPSALADIDNIANYIAHNSLQGAKSQVQSFLNRAKVLEKFPEIGRLVPELKVIRYRQILEGHYRIIYQIVEEDVHILTVHHQSMLLKNNPVFKSKLRNKK